MNHYRFEHAVWLGAAAVAAIVIHQPSAVAMSPQEVARLAQTLTVQVNPSPNDPAQRSGSGFIVAKDGDRYTILTCNHVLRGQPASVRTHDGQSYPIVGSQSLSTGGMDLALLTFESAADYPVAQIGNSDQAEVGAQIFVFGFPVNVLQQRTGEERYFEFSPGYVTSRLPSQEGGYTIRYNAVTQPGMSGGPVFDIDGRVIGIHGMGENDVATVRDLQSGTATPEISVQTKTGFNSAIPINIFVAMQEQGSASVPTLEVDRRPSSDQPQQTLQNPNSSLAYDARAQARDSQGDRAGAMADFNEALRLDPSNATVYYRRGNLRDSQGDRQGAVQDYSQAIALNPGFYNAYYNRAVVRNNMGDLRGAAEDFTAAINLNPADLMGYFSRGTVRYSLQDAQGTLEDFDMVVRIAPNLYQGYYNRAIAWSMLGHSENAIIDLDQTLAINPGYTPAFLSRARNRSRVGDHQGSIEDLTYVLSYEPNNAAVYYNRGLSRQDMGDYQGAAADFQRASTLFQESGDVANAQVVLRAMRRLPIGNSTSPNYPVPEVTPNTTPFGEI
jgi:tetratricopeptide (TPR) repeat protein